MEAKASFCREHAGRTCCDTYDIISIRNKFEAARKMTVGYEENDNGEDGEDED